jgi:glucose-1-phosphate adenylyltransferase
VQIWAAEQTPDNTDWYQGTADAVRKQTLEISSTNADYVMILAGDHLYRMDYEAMARYHWENDADITVAVQPVHRDEASRFGLLKRNKSGRIVSFVEKPKDQAILDEFVSRDDPDRPFLGSMGIYMFTTKVLNDLLKNAQDHDFGGEVIPRAIGSHSVYGFDFDGYWEDIGTIRSFYDTNLRLAFPDSPFNFQERNQPIFTRARFLPGSTIEGANLQNVLLGDGCLIGQAEIINSVIGLRSQIAAGTRIKDSILMGADFYEARDLEPHPDINLGIGENCDIQGAIIDKNVRFGPGVKIRPFPVGTEINEGEHGDNQWVVRDGIVVIPKKTVFPSGTYIGPE